MLIENLTAYLFLMPAGVIIFLFGIFPVIFALYVSLHRWRRFPGDYQGLDNYLRSLDNFAYVFFFWLALAALYFAGSSLWQYWQQSRNERRALAYLVAGVVTGLGLLLAVRWFFTLLPVVLDIPQRIRGQERVQGLFVGELAASFQMPDVVSAANWMLLTLGVGLLLAFIVSRVVRSQHAWSYLLWSAQGALLAALAGLTLQLVAGQISADAAEAQAGSGELSVWSQIILISLGVVLLGGAYLLWKRATRQESSRRFILMIVAAIALMAGGYLLVAELPLALADADDDMLQGYSVTVMFVIGTVPVQLALGLGLAYLLFQNIKGKAFFRLVYFLPYIMPFVATSIVFKLIFSHRPTSPINSLITGLGLPQQNWLLEPTGINELLFGAWVPDLLAGPSLALVVIMLYTIWTYIGYDTVIFLAGLVNIPGELYEAARIDGASGWSVFRHITLPLLSPTTFFLSLIAIIGTFQAFTQVWIMRTPSSARAVDTVSVYIFETVRGTDPNMGYGSAMAFVLFVAILLLTLVQNRIAERRVFYG